MQERTSDGWGERERSNGRVKIGDKESEGSSWDSSGNRRRMESAGGTNDEWDGRGRSNG